jgi:energy-coupling factor transport system permease protein
MERFDEFTIYHPFVNLIYFALAIALCMINLHPLVLALGAIGSFGYLVYMKGRRAFSALWFSIITAAVLTGFNVLFNHRGETIILYFKNGNPLTLESITNGAALGISFGCMLLWFACVNEVMTSDRLMCILSRAVPSLSVLMTVTLRFIPLYIRQIKRSSADRRAFYGKSQGQLKHSFAIIDNVSGQALEMAIDSADVMHSRGLGLKGRTAFSPFVFGLRDVLMLIYLSAAAAAAFTLSPKADYLPSYSADTVSIAGTLAVAALLLMPLAVNLIFRRRLNK